MLSFTASIKTIVDKVRLRKESLMIEKTKDSIVKYLKYYYFSANRFYCIDRKTKRLVKRAYKLSMKKEKEAEYSQEDYPVDFVVTWVDEKDSAWQKEKTKFQNIQSNTKKDVTTSMYRNWDNLQYWFRAVEKNAPWVRYIFFVTYGHIPSWLNTNNPKIRIIKHADYIPKEYLPTFNSRVIEINFWQIKELSENFVYFNDDMYLTNKVDKSFFFFRALPRLCAVTKPNKPKLEMVSWDFARYNNCRACNSRFNIRKVMEQHPEKWFSNKYGRNIKYNLRTYEDGYLSGMVYPHVAYAFRKSAMEDCYYCFQNLFESTCSHRFRTNDDLNIQIFEMWEMMHNSFEPSGGRGALINVDETELINLKDKLNDKSVNCVCINDSMRINANNFDMNNSFVNKLLQDKFPEKSSFES